MCCLFSRPYWVEIRVLWCRAKNSPSMTTTDKPSTMLAFLLGKYVKGLALNLLM